MPGELHAVLCHAFLYDRNPTSRAVCRGAVLIEAELRDRRRRQQTWQHVRPSGDDESRQPLLGDD